MLLLCLSYLKVSSTATKSHDLPIAGHRGYKRTLERLRQSAYWVNMAKDVLSYCRSCEKCQQSKLALPQRAPLTNIPIGNPWHMIAVDILEVPISTRNNRYLLVVQDYFTKWVEAIPLPNQTAPLICAELLKLFSTFGQPDILLSDQGHNFESTIFKQTLEAFGVEKVRTTAYHPQGDGMVERFNRTLLQLFRTFVDRPEDWEEHLPLILYAYRTSVHSSTGYSPFTLMYGHQPKSLAFSPPKAFDPASYQAHLQAKLAELQMFVKSNITAAATSQKDAYDTNSTTRDFQVDDPVWLSIPTSRKLYPKWEGGWKIKAIKSPVNMEITDGQGDPRH